MTYGTYIRRLREARGLSINHFAQSIGISAAYWSRIEREQEKPPKDGLIEAAALVLETSLDEAYIQAGRLPPDLREHLGDIVAMWRSKEARRGK